MVGLLFEGGELSLPANPRGHTKRRYRQNFQHMLMHMLKSKMLMHQNFQHMHHAHTHTNHLHVNVNAVLFLF